MNTLEMLIRDAEKAYSTGKIKPHKGEPICKNNFFENNSILMGDPIVAAWAFNNNYSFPGPSFCFGIWAINHYQIPENILQGFIDGWDDNPKQFREDKEYLVGYKVGKPTRKRFKRFNENLIK